MSQLNDQLKDIFENAEFQPSDRVWQGVENALVQKKKKGIFFMWQTYASAAAVLFLAAFAFLLSQNGSPVDTKSGKELRQDQFTEVLADTTRQESDKTEASSLSNVAEVDDDPLTDNLETVTDDKSIFTPSSNVKQGILNLSVTNTDISKEEMASIESSPEKHTLTFIDLKEYRESLAREILAFNAKMSFSAFQPIKTYTVGPENGKDESKAFRINGGFGTGALNTGESGIFAAAEDDALATFNEARVDLFNGEEEVESVISVGAGVNFSISNKLSLDLGLRLTNFRLSSSSNAYAVEDGLSLPISATAPFNEEELVFVGQYGTTNTFQSIFLQSALNYKVASVGRFDLNSRLGIGLDYFFNYKLQGDLNFLSVRSVNLNENDINPLSLSFIPGLGINYRLNNQFGIAVDASYRRFFTSSEVSVNGATSIFGFGFSLNYLIGKD